MLHPTFIPYLPDKTRSLYEYEIIQSKARSHAAKVSHRKRPNIVLDRQWATPQGDQSVSGYRIQTPLQGLNEPTPSSTLIKPHSSLRGVNFNQNPEEDDRKPVSEAVCPRSSSLNAPSKPESASPNPWHWTKGARVDPFDCVTGSNRYEAAFAIDFLVHHVMPAVASINEVFNVVNVYGRWVLENMAKYEDYFHVMLGLATLAHYAVVAPPGTPLPEIAFLHTGQAISKLRHRLASPNSRPDDGAILTILQLAMFERGLGNDVASKAHKAQVSQMVASRGGTDRLGFNSSVRATLTIFLSLDGEQTPATTPLPSRPPSVDSNPLTTFRFMKANVEMFRALPVGFQNLARTGALSSEILQIIYRVSVKRHWTPLEVLCKLQDEKRSEIYWPQDGQAWNFWDVCTALRITEGPDSPLLEKLVCLALFRYCSNRAIRLRSKACIYHTATMQLTALLPTCTVPKSRSERDCLIWVWLVAIDSWAMEFNCSGLSSEGLQLLAQLRKALPELQDWEWWDLEALGQKFFWRDELGVLLGANWIPPEQEKGMMG